MKCIGFKALAGAFISFALLFFSLIARGQEMTQQHRDQRSLCLSLQSEGRWLEAREVALELVTAFASAPPSRHQLVFTSDLANLDQRLGDYARAKAGYGKCLEIAEAISGSESTLVSQLKNNLAALHQVLGNFETAEELNREALEIREQVDGKGSATTVPAINNLAGLLWCIGDLDGAENRYREALEIRLTQLGSDHLDTARSRANLGGLLFYQNKIDEAAILVREAAVTFEAKAGPGHPDTLEVLLFLGEIERAVGNTKSAKALYTRVRDGRRAAFGDRPHVETAEAERRLGDAHRELQEYEAALEAYARSEALYRAVLREDHPDLIEGLYGAGLAAIADDDTAKARQKADQCSEVELSNLEAVLQFTDERQRLAYQNLFRSHHLYANLGDAEGVAEFLLRRKGIVFDSLITEARLMQSASSPEAIAAATDLNDARTRFRTAFLSTTESLVDIGEAEEEVRKAHRRLQELTAGSVQGDDFRTLKLSALQAELPPGEVLIDYLFYDRYSGGAEFETRIGAAVVTGQSVEFFDCASEEEVSRIISGLAPFFGGVQPDDEVAEQVLRSLFQSLIQPFETSLSPAELIHLCPEGALNFVPFACLMDADGKFLIERFDLSYVSAARELLNDPDPVPSSQGAFLVGNPQFNTGANKASSTSDQRGFLASLGAANLSVFAQGISQLEGAELEVQQLSGLLDSMNIPTRSLYGLEATESVLRKEAAQPYILHLATHGIYLPDMIPSPGETRSDSSFVPDEIAGFQNPLFGSWITLAGSGNTIESWAEGRVPDPASDGILMANEAAELNLKGTLVVTLSACDTASGEATSGDGVLGIRRGFRLAGAENVMSTLWPINDAMTPGIMYDFYEGLAGSSPTESINKAQRKWLTTIRDDPAAVTLPLANGSEVRVGGLYWAINLAGPFLLSR